jgi:hypothetical protein
MAPKKRDGARTAKAIAVAAAAAVVVAAVYRRMVKIRAQKVLALHRALLGVSRASQELALHCSDTERAWTEQMGLLLENMQRLLRQPSQSAAWTAYKNIRDAFGPMAANLRLGVEAFPAEQDTAIPVQRAERRAALQKMQQSVRSLCDLLAPKIV